ncbi:hypothetical protein KMP13_02840 [Epibacterium ulvae]|nr:hypothetical protein [Epibacterium ulvae]
MIASDGAEREGEIKSSFVDRRTYRRRRLMDLSRMLPVFGALLLMLPLMWSPSGTDAPTWSMSAVLIYVFTTWVGLILLALVFGMAVRRWAYHWIDAPYAPTDDREGH